MNEHPENTQTDEKITLVAWMGLATFVLAVLLVGWAFVSFLLSIDAQGKTVEQANSMQDQIWKERILTATDSEERQLLKAVRSEVRRKDCHPDYKRERQQARRSEDPEIFLAFVQKHENHCVRNMIAKAKLQQDPGRFLPVMERISNP